MTEVADAVKCPKSGTHTWTYMGKESQTYRCTGCGDTVGKGRLKAETDPRPELDQLTVLRDQVRALGGTPNA